MVRHPLSWTDANYLIMCTLSQIDVSTSEAADDDDDDELASLMETTTPTTTTTPKDSSRTTPKDSTNPCSIVSGTTDASKVSTSPVIPLPKLEFRAFRTGEELAMRHARGSDGEDEPKETVEMEEIDEESLAGQPHISIGDTETMVNIEDAILLLDEHSQPSLEDKQFQNQQDKENKPEDKENKPEDKGNKPEDKENKPEDKENKPEDKENKPEDKENKPENKENKQEDNKNKQEDKENNQEDKENEQEDKVSHLHNKGINSSYKQNQKNDVVEINKNQRPLQDKENKSLRVCTPSPSSTHITSTVHTEHDVLPVVYSSPLIEIKKPTNLKKRRTRSQFKCRKLSDVTSDATTPEADHFTCPKTPLSASLVGDTSITSIVDPVLALSVPTAAITSDEPNRGDTRDLELPILETIYDESKKSEISSNQIIIPETILNISGLLCLLYICHIYVYIY